MEQESLQERLRKIEANAKARIKESVPVKRDASWFKRTVHVPTEPIYIASTEDIGTRRVRANHLDAAIDYCIEQEKLKAMGAPIL